VSPNAASQERWRVSLDGSPRAAGVPPNHGTSEVEYYHQEEVHDRESRKPYGLQAKVFRRINRKPQTFKSKA